MPKGRSDVYLVSSRPTDNGNTGYDNTAFSSPDKQADNGSDGPKVVYRYVVAIENRIADGQSQKLQKVLSIHVDIEFTTANCNSKQFIKSNSV